MIELYSHQETALNLLRLNSGFALFMEQGTGKSFPVLFRIKELADSAKAHTALIVAPKAVCESWREKIALLESDQPWFFEGVRIEIVSYDTVWRRKEYADGTFDVVVLDESHYVKNPTAKRTKTCLKICSRAEYRWILTGTPTSNGQLCNIWSQFAAIDPVVEHGRVYPRMLGGDSYYKWLDRTAYLNQWHKPYKYRDVAALQETIGEWSYRVTKEECLDLPDKLPDEILSVELSAKAKSDYRKMMESSAIAELDALAGNPLTRALRLRQIASGFLETDSGTVEYPNPKIAALKEFLEDFEGKVAIFCQFRRSIDAVADALGSLKMHYAVLDGRQSDKGVWRRFQDDPEVRAIVCQYQSGSAGIDLYAADTMVFFEPSDSSNLTEQARDRIHRIGQHRPCSYYWLIAKGTIERDMHRALAAYQDFGEALFTRYMETYTKGWRV